MEGSWKIKKKKKGGLRPWKYETDLRKSIGKLNGRRVSSVETIENLISRMSSMKHGILTSGSLGRLFCGKVLYEKLVRKSKYRGQKASGELVGIS